MMKTWVGFHGQLAMHKRQTRQQLGRAANRVQCSRGRKVVEVGRIKREILAG